jgi:hypothetical protein
MICFDDEGAKTGNRKKGPHDAFALMRGGLEDHWEGFWDTPFIGELSCVTLSGCSNVTFMHGMPGKVLSVDGRS